MYIPLLAIFGLVMGSFLGAYTFRYPRGISVLRGRSVCPKCKKNLVWYDNIPVLSFILLKGRCRECGKKISLRYPLIELATALGFVGIWFLFLEPVFLVFLILIFSLLVAVFVIDLEQKIVPDELVFTGFGLTVFYLLLISPSTLFTSLAAGFGAALFLLLVHLATRGRGMGLGDVKFAVFAGTLLGWPMMPVWLFTAFLTGAVVGTILVLAKKVSFGKQIAFGPFLVISLIIVFIWGEKFINLFFY
ncbi:prepilin peptidase [Candidatus Woesebacteria bacterium]|nr:MAG: prepilin peptidase [Candidatus Woesebacteria bacterium]